jgi:hypothetical protein
VCPSCSTQRTVLGVQKFDGGERRADSLKMNGNLMEIRGFKIARNTSLKCGSSVEMSSLSGGTCVVTYQNYGNIWKGTSGTKGCESSWPVPGNTLHVEESIQINTIAIWERWYKDNQLVAGSPDGPYVYLREASA